MPRDPTTGGYRPPKHHKRKKSSAPFFGPSDVATETVRRHRAGKKGPGPVTRRARHEAIRRAAAQRRYQRIEDARARVEAAQNELSGPSRVSPYSTLMRQRASAAAVTGGLPGFVDQLGKDLSEAALYSVPGTYELLKGGALDVRDIALAGEHAAGLRQNVEGGDWTPTRTTTTLGQMGQQMAQDIRHPLRHPGYTLLDALAVGSVGASVAARTVAGAGAAAAARSAGASVPRAARAALTRPGYEGGSLLRKPIPGREEIAPGVFFRYSNNPLVAAFQKRRVRKGLADEESRTVGGYAHRPMVKTIGHERTKKARIEQDIARARPAALLKESKGGMVRRGRSKAEEMAVRLVGEQAPLMDRIRMHKEAFAEIKGKSPTARLARRKISARIKLLQDVERLELVSEKATGLEPAAKLEALVNRSESSILRREDIWKELGLATEERLAASRHAPGRVVAGARYEKPTPSKRGIKSEKHVAAEKRVERLEKIHERAKELAAKRAAPVELVDTGNVIERLTERPRTLDEAKTRLAALDKLYEEQIKAIEDKLTGGQKADMAEVLRRNRENQRKFKKGGGARAGAAARAEKRGGIVKRTKTVKEELRDMAETEFHKALESGDKRMAELATLMKERDQLRNAVNERAFPLEEGPPPSLGAKKETVKEKERKPSEIPPKGTYTATTEYIGSQLSGARGELERFEARAAKAERPTGIVGGEGARPGRFYVPRGERKGMIGRAATGAGEAVGVVKAKRGLRGTYTGVSTRFATDPIRAVRAIAESELEAQRISTAIRTRDYAESISISSPDYFKMLEDNPKAASNFIPFRVRGVNRRTGEPLESAVPFNKATREFVDRVTEKANAGERLTRQDKRDLRAMGDEAVNFFFPTRSEGRALAKTAENQVRWVDGRKMGGTQKASTVRLGGHALFELPARLADEFNALNQLAILFLKPAYFLPNFIGQVALAAIHQGFMAPVNLAHAAHAWKHMSAEERIIVRAGIDEGLARGAQFGGKVAGPVRDVFAQGYGKVLDSPFRWPAFVHEMRKLGYREPSDIARAVKEAAETKTGKVHEDVLEAFQRTRDAMVDYSDLSPWEQRLFRRAIFFYPWVKGSTVYTGRFLRDHPIQAAVIAQSGRKVAPDIRRTLGPVPFYARGLFPVGKDKQGRPLVVDATAAQLFGYPAQIAEALKGIAQANPKPSYTLTDFLSPAAAFPLQLALPHDPLQGYQLPSIREGLKRQYFTGLPQYRLYKGITDPTDEDPDVLFPTSPETAIRKYTIGGIFPHPVNVKELNARAKEEGEVGLSPAERAYRAVFADRQAVFNAAKKYVPNELVRGRLPATVREAFNRKAARDAMLAAVEDKTEPATVERERVKYQSEVALLLKWKLIPKDLAAITLGWAKTASYEDIVDSRTKLSDRYFRGAYTQLLLDVHKYLEQKGATFAAG